MADEEHLKVFKRGACAWNEWRRENPDVEPNLYHADLRGFWNLAYSAEGATYPYDLREANLEGANFSSADLTGATFRAANLTLTNFTRAFLEDDDFNGANLEETDFSAAHLGSADFSNCKMRRTRLSEVDLSGVRGLETIRHSGPSTIGIDTIYQSRGRIPEIFLRGAGLPENFITFMHSLVGTAFEFYSCFISYSIKDREFAERLHADLQTAGVRCWYFPEDAQWGQPVWGEIDRSIKAHDKLVVICSTDALQSGPVNREIERALQREDRDRRHVLFPIRLDEYIFENWQHPRKADVQSKVIGDFRDWKNHDSYKKSFARLLRDLKVEDKTDSAVQGS